MLIRNCTKCFGLRSYLNFWGFSGPSSSVIGSTSFWKLCALIVSSASHSNRMWCESIFNPFSQIVHMGLSILPILCSWAAITLQPYLITELQASSKFQPATSHNIKCISRNSVHHKIGGFFKKCSVGCWKCGERGLVRVGAFLNQNFLEGGQFWKEGRCGNFIIFINQLISTERSLLLGSLDP